jgi:MFS family permease
MNKETKKWLNSTVWGTSLTSFLSDFGHESVTVLLPSFLASIGAPVYALGIIEGFSDGLSSFAKLFSGYYSDKLGKRKEIATLGYVATGVFPAIVAISMSWPVVLIGRLFGWIGRGVRGPPRDAILAKSVQEEDLGKAFGVHRAGDTLGAIAGPALAFLLLSWVGIRDIFWLAVIPGMLAAIVFALAVKEEKTSHLESHKSIILSMREFSPQFKKFLFAVFLFGIADFSHTMLILFAVTMLTPSMGFVQATSAGILLYGLRNVVYAAACYPFGALGDKLGRGKMLVFGYTLAVIMFIGFIISPPDIISYGFLFGLAGVYIAAEDTLEGAVSGHMVEEQRRALGFGALATVNGVGDFVSSLVVGMLWSIFGFTAGFFFAAVVGSIGIFALLRNNNFAKQILAR